MLALDLATHCGWALVEADRVTRSGCLALPGPKPGQHPGVRYLQLQAWLRQGAWPAGLVLAYEDVQSHERREKATGRRWFATEAAHVYGGLRAIVLAWAAAQGVPPMPVGVGTWKAALGCPGGSHAPKAVVLAQVRLLGFKPATQDEADAIGIGLYAYRRTFRNG